ncbi:MAG: 16S rRNA (guanine(966)-N(2))-methyltransferase RsmD [Clostridia bacterium]|nr:16S rRNA (guanine(966)-N(2))-methyltransferase RsmD [Clostridia bacterium]
MRVITGEAKGRALETLEGEDTRPTVARVKEGLFSAIAFEIAGRRVLDLFAGSGQMGIEALSRGAVSCLFVDRNPKAAAVIGRNLASTKLAHRAAVVCGEALSVLSRQTEPFDLVFLDPPYAANLLAPCLALLSDKVSSGGAVLCESDRDTVLPETVGSLVLQRTYRYGRVVVRLYRKE